MIVQFILDFLLEVDEHDAAVLVLYCPESVGLEVDDEGAALQVSQFALQALVLAGEFGIFGLQATLVFAGTFALRGTRRKILRLYRSCDGRFGLLFRFM